MTGPAEAAPPDQGQADRARANESVRDDARGARGASAWRADRLHLLRWGFVLLGFALRLAWVLAVPSKPVGDFAMYRESAAYLVAHGHLDPDFIYMPGYIGLLALVDLLGGGVVAAKVVGALAGTAVVAAAGGLGQGLFDRRTGAVAAALAALWPAGIAVASVTGTDMPAAALVTCGVWALIAFARTRPRLAAVLSGVVLGAAAWIRAVAMPLAGMAFFVWWALGHGWRTCAKRAAIGVGTALLILLPWAIRNWRVTGELFFTDSHGGYTALVGADPNAEGTYSRSLNRMILPGTGYHQWEPPARHRLADHAAFALAKRFAATEPVYAIGLLAAKADRLLAVERNLLYWPLYRAGVLRDDDRAFFDRHRPELEHLTDGYWWAVAALGVAGLALAVRRRAVLPLAAMSFPVALCGIYTLFFSEVRYHLAIVPFAFPFAAFTLVAAWGTTARARARRRAHAVGAGRAVATSGPAAPGLPPRDFAVAAAAVTGFFALWFGAQLGGESLRDRHRWATSVCRYPDADTERLCFWLRVRPSSGDSPVRGIWDGFGLRLPDPGLGARGDDDVVASARTQLTLPAGRYRLRADVELGKGGAAAGASASTGAGPGAPPSAPAPADSTGPVALTYALRAGDRVFARVAVPASGGAPIPPGVVRISGVFDHPGGGLSLFAEVERGATGAQFPVGQTVWMTGLVLERF